MRQNVRVRKIDAELTGITVDYRNTFEISVESAYCVNPCRLKSIGPRHLNAVFLHPPSWRSAKTVAEWVRDIRLEYQPAVRRFDRLELHYLRESMVRGVHAQWPRPFAEK